MSFDSNDQFADFLNLDGCTNPRIDSTSLIWDVHATLRLDAAACPYCGNTAVGKPRRKKPRVIWDAPVRGQRVRIIVTPHGYSCFKCCRKHTAPIPWVDVHHRVSLRGVDYILHRVGTKRWALHEVAAEMGPDEKTISAIFKEYAEKLEALGCNVDSQRFEIIECEEAGKILCSIADKETGEVHKLYFAKRDAERKKTFLGSLGKVAPRRLAIDEFRFGRHYVCVLYDRDAGQVFDMIFDRDNESLMGVYFSLLRGREFVEIVTMDRSKLFRAVVEEHFVKAIIIADPWHLAKNILGYMKKIRTSVEESLEGDNKKSFSSDRYMLFKHSENLSTGQQKSVDEWIQSEPEIAEAYRAKEGLLAIWKIGEDSVHASKLYEAWREGLSEKQREQFGPLIKSFDDWADPIFAYFDHKYTNAIAESLNRISRERVREARGCSYELLRAVMMYPLLLSNFMLKETGKSGPALTQVPIAELLLKVETDAAQNMRAVAKPNPGLFIVERHEHTSDDSPIRKKNS